MSWQPDSPDSIVELFIREGDALQRAGFALPDLSVQPAEHVTIAGLDQVETPAYLEMPPDVLAGYETYLQLGDIALEG